MFKLKAKHRQSMAGIIMFLPYAILLMLFAIIPIGRAFSTSMTPSLANPEGGFGNYLFVINDFRFWPAVINISTFLAIYLPTMVIVVAALSLLLDSIKSRVSVSLRLAYLVPASITGAVAILVWYFMLEPQYSPFKGILAEAGITSGTQVFAQNNLVWVFALMAFFTGAGNWIVIQYGSLQSIPDEILEAAKIDGANAFQTALRIKLPLIKKYLIYMTILTFAAGLQIFV
jgi:multiple sugar transport system permease protein